MSYLKREKEKKSIDKVLVTTEFLVKIDILHLPLAQSLIFFHFLLVFSGFLLSSSFCPANLDAEQAHMTNVHFKFLTSQKLTLLLNREALH